MKSSILKLRTGRDYDAFGFDDEYFHGLMSHMGISPETLDFPAFEHAHFELLFAFLRAEKIEKNSVSIEVENKAVTKVQKLAGDLADALIALEQTGQAGLRLHRELLASKGGAFECEGVKIANLLGHAQYQPFDTLTDILFDIRVGLELTKISKPKALKPPVSEGHTVVDRDRIVRIVASAGSAVDPIERYKLGREAHSLPPNFAVLTFVEAFEDMWHQFCDLPFTEAKYEPDARQTISQTVDAAEHCLQKFGAKFPRSLIATKVRTVREERYEA